MKSIEAATCDGTKPTGQSATKKVRWLYAGMAVLLLVMTIWGFQQFYFHGKATGGRPLTPPIRTLVIVHGIAMSAWMILLIVQSLLVTTGKIRWHMALGKAGAVLAVCIFVSGFKLGIESARFIPPHIMIAPAGTTHGGLSAKPFMTVPIFSIIVFGVFVALAIYFRKNAALHRPLMLFATIGAVGAATFRTALFRPLHESFMGTIFGAAAGPVLLGVLFLVVHSVVVRTFDRQIAAILTIYCVIWASVTAFAPTKAWEGIANFLLGV